jgi:hypothetical protein
MKRTFPLVLLLIPSLVRAEVIVAEGEQFTPKDSNGWRHAHQDESYGSHTYGGMWMTHGGCLLAPADAKGAVAEQTVQVPAAGKYRVWSKYQAPPYFNYLHKVEVLQGGKPVFAHVYGKKGTPNRFWSFGAVSDECWWPWGVDHDCAEAPKELADLAAGPAVIRLTAVENPKPAGNRCVDFLVLTTKTADDYEGYKPLKVGSPFALEALAATKLYLRFKNSSDKPAQLTVARSGHFQPDYGQYTTKVPAQPVAAGQWSEWVNIGPFCRLVHDEGLTLTLGAGKEFHVQFARDAAGKDVVGDLTASDGDAAIVPIDVTWRENAHVKTSRQHAKEVVAASKTWRKANGGKKPKDILFYGAFGGNDEWVNELKDALGYNTQLPDKYDHVKRDQVHAHYGSIPEIQKLAQTVKDKDRVRVISFGDEISLGKIDYKDPKLNAKFREWLKAKKLAKADLGVEPEAASLTDTGSGRLVWYSNLFNEEERFAAYRAMTEEAKKLFGKEVLTGANYSPHHLALCYGPVFQWVDVFKHNGMSMFWAEDYIFSVPEAPQMISWMFAQMRCATKYNHQPIHMYVMPHAPGQEPGYLRRNTLLSLAYGAKHIDSFWVAPAERFTENYVGWHYRDTFKTLSEAIFDAAEVEKYLVEGKLRPAKVAIVLSKATDFNESRLMVKKANDPFARDCANAPAEVNQILCRKEQQMLYLALRRYCSIDLITEDDIAESDALKNYQSVYFAGEWIDHRIIPKIEAWVKTGGNFFACGGCGHRNEFDEPEPAMLKLLGLKEIKTEKNTAVIRTLLELPQLSVMDSIVGGSLGLDAVGMKQVLVPETAKAFHQWKDGSVAVTSRELGKGRIISVGAMPGLSWMKSGVRTIPWARGGSATLYNPSNKDLAQLIPLAAVMRDVGISAVDSVEVGRKDGARVEAIVRDHPEGALLTVINWENDRLQQVSASIPMPAKPREVRSVSQQKAIPFEYKDGTVTFKIDLADAEFIVIKK